MPAQRKSLVDQVLAQARFSEERLIFEAGVALQYAFAPPNVRYSAPYVEMGRELWIAAEYEIHSLLCDRNGRKAREWVVEVVSGDARDLVIAIMTALVASLNVPLSIAIPIAALAVKRELAAFCRLRPKKPKRSLSEIVGTQHPKSGGIPKGLTRKHSTRNKTRVR